MKIKMNKKHILILTCLAFFMIFTLSFMGAQTKLSDQNQFDPINTKDIPQVSGYELSPFTIDDDGGGDYTWAQAVIEYNSTGQCVGSTFTDEDGFFYFVEIDEGEYEVHILYDGYTDFEIVTAIRDEMILVLFVIPDEDL